MPNTTPNRVAFFVDGFNLYHSLKAAQRLDAGSSIKWLDLPGLCKSLLYLVGNRAFFQEVHYFSAFAEHLAGDAPEKLQRHKVFVRALTARKVIVHLGHFRKKQVWSGETQQWVSCYEEKETDVAIACEVLSLAFQNAFDTAVMITGDSDFAPLYRTFGNCFPDKRLLFAFPFQRVSKELKQLAPNSFVLSRELYLGHQMPPAVRLPSGKFVRRPVQWEAAK